MEYDYRGHPIRKIGSGEQPPHPKPKLPQFLQQRPPYPAPPPPFPAGGGLEPAHRAPVYGEAVAPGTTAEVLQPVLPTEYTDGSLSTAEQTAAAYGAALRVTEYRVMMHLAVYSAAIASATANQQLAALADPIIAPSGKGYLVNAQVPKVLRVIAQGGLLNRAQLMSASIRDYAPFDLNPVNVGTLIESPGRYIDFSDNPIPLKPDEELDVFVSNSAATSTQTSVAVLMGDGPIRPVRGRIFSVHWTITTTFAAAGFTAFTPVLDNGIPAGTFALVGSRLVSASALFHRIIPRGGSPFRPGSSSAQAYDQHPEMFDRMGNMGEWLRFTNTTLPQIEAFQLAADAAADGFLDLIQVA